jgi:hypothetical protein
MLEIKLRKSNIEVFEGIYDLDLDRYIEFAVLFLEDSHVGSTIESVGRHYQQFHQFISTQKIDKIHREAMNLHANYFNAIERLNTTSLSFAPFLYKIDGNIVFENFQKDFSIDKARQLLSDVSNKGLKYQHVSSTLDDVKKKLISNFEPLFQIDLEAQTPITTTI